MNLGVAFLRYIRIQVAYQQPIGLNLLLCLDIDKDSEVIWLSQHSSDIKKYESMSTRTRNLRVAHRSSPKFDAPRNIPDSLKFAIACRVTNL